MKFSEHLTNYGVTKLFYLAPIENLSEILKRGILCRQLAEKYQSYDISAQYAQINRKKNYPRVHSYVPLFFADNTPMLYNRVERYGMENVILLEISPEVTNKDGILFFDGSAAKKSNKYDNPVYLGKLNWDIISDRRGAWAEPWISIRSAEIHIPECCPASYIQGVYFQSRLTGGQSKITKILNEFPALHKIFVKSLLTSTGIKQC